VPVALRVGEIGFLPRNLSDRLFIFYPTLGYEPPLAPEIGGINAGPTISRPKLIREIVLFGDVMQSLLACRSSLIDWKGWV